VLLPVSALIFLTAFCVFIALYLTVMERQNSPKAELKRRLQRMARSGAKEMPEELRSEITREVKPADKFFADLPLTRNLDKKLDQGGIKLSVSLYLAATAAVAAAAATVVLLRTKSLLLTLVAVGLCILLAELYVKFKVAQRREKFTELFPDALAMIARSLRAGHSFTAAIQLVGQEVPSPVGDLFKTAYDQQLLGLRIIDGLNNMNERMESLDLRFFTTVISINSETGGNLSEVLDKLAQTIRERLRIRRQVKVYTAQGRMSGYVLAGLPIVAFVAFSFMNPDYESALLKEPLGIYILSAAAALQLVGVLFIRKIINIKI
jgi:tight adherence protein B